MNNTESWIQAARWSPSGGNSQPWRVQIQHTTTGLLINVTIREAIQRHSSAADQWGAGALTALGCFIETLNELAPNFGIHLLESPNNPKVTSNSSTYWLTQIQIEFTGIISDQKQICIPEYISNRTSNRWPMKTAKLPSTLLATLGSAINRVLLKNLWVKLAIFS